MGFFKRGDKVTWTHNNDWLSQQRATVLRTGAEVASGYDYLVRFEERGGEEMLVFESELTPLNPMDINEVEEFLDAAPRPSP